MTLGTTPRQSKKRTNAEGKSRRFPTTHQARVVENSSACQASHVGRKSGPPRAPEGLGIGITTHLAVQPAGGTSIDEIGHLDHMCPLADRGSAGTLLASFKSN